MVKTLHFKDFEIDEMIKFCKDHEDIRFEYRKIKDKYRPHSITMWYNKEKTNNEIYKKIEELRN